MEFYRILPELFLLCATSLLLITHVSSTSRSSMWTYVLSQTILVITLVLSVFQFNTDTFYGFNGNFVRDHLTTLLEIIMTGSAFIVFVFSRTYIQDRGNLDRGEFYILALFSLLGMMVLVSANSLLVLYLGLELMSLPLYAMVALWRENKHATEAAIKYFIMGALASGLLLYGMSMIFGVTGHLHLSSITQSLTNTQTTLYPVLVFGLVLMMVGIAFKLGLAPFHAWAPDVYHGAPTVVTQWIAAAPKCAGFALLFRLLIITLSGLNMQWQPILILIAVLSMAVGNIVAIAQTNIKRLFAYSGIAHMGYMLLGFIAATPDGYSAALFYMVTYVISALAGFSMLVILSASGFECEKLSDLQGLNSRSPWLAFMMLLIVFSMAGIPPLVGFFAKLSLLEALIDVNHIGLAVTAIVFAIIGLYYYLRVVRTMYFEKPHTHEPINWYRDQRVVASVNSIALLFFGLFPGALLALCHSVF